MRGDGLVWGYACVVVFYEVGLSLISFPASFLVKSRSHFRLKSGDMDSENGVKYATITDQS